jgi:catechol 2,3-dioxygenase-like lactoylglutathione lyase family enzyme
MKRFHVHVRVSDLDSSVKFYSTLFGTAPAVVKADYAKWMLEDPRVNFALSAGSEVGIDHLGFELESDDDLVEVARRFAASGAKLIKQENAACCYARGNKGWLADPIGISWEAFHTFGESTVYGNDVIAREALDPGPSEACCTPKADATVCCRSAKAPERRRSVRKSQK